MFNTAVKITGVCKQRFEWQTECYNNKQYTLLRIIFGVRFFVRKQQLYCPSTTPID
jgi:hypothetical protein